MVVDLRSRYGGEDGERRGRAYAHGKAGCSREVEAGKVL